MRSYSGKEVIRAGEALISNDIFTDEDRYNQAMDVLSFWRSQHEEPLVTALSIVKKIVEPIDKDAILAKRLKRTPSIIRKLKRFEDTNMKLKSMQDIGGCRVVVSSPKKLQKLFKALKKLPYFKNEQGRLRCKDYISKPKEDGYRSYHLVGRFSDRVGSTKLIEVQLRTRLQHDWATTLEIVELFTGEALKSNGGSEQWQNFFAKISEQFAIMEDIHIFQQLQPRQQQIEYYALLQKDKRQISQCSEITAMDYELGVLKKLNHYTHSLKMTNELIEDLPNTHYVLLQVDTKGNELTYQSFSKAQFIEAEDAYTKAEKKHSNNTDMTVALVYASAVGGIKEAYPNYFADSQEFARYLVLVKTAANEFEPRTIRKWINSFSPF